MLQKQDSGTSIKIYLEVMTGNTSKEWRNGKEGNKLMQVFIGTGNYYNQLGLNPIGK